MKFFHTAIASTLLMATTAIAETIRLAPGSEITLSPEREVTVACGLGGDNDYKVLCICTDDSTNWVDFHLIRQTFYRGTKVASVHAGKFTKAECLAQVVGGAMCR